MAPTITKSTLALLGLGWLATASALSSGTFTWADSTQQCGVSFPFRLAATITASGVSADLAFCTTRRMMLTKADIQRDHLQWLSAMDARARVSRSIPPGTLRPALTARRPISGQPIYWDITAPPRYDPARSVDAQVCLPCTARLTELCTCVNGLSVVDPPAAIFGHRLHRLHAG